MTPDDARRELRLAITRSKRARKKTAGALASDPGGVVMVTEEVAVALLADLREFADLNSVIAIIEGWESDAGMSVFGADGEVHAAEERAYGRVLDLLRGVS